MCSMRTTANDIGSTKNTTHARRAGDMPCMFVLTERGVLQCFHGHGVVMYQPLTPDYPWGISTRSLGTSDWTYSAQPASLCRGFGREAVMQSFWLRLRKIWLTLVPIQMSAYPGVCCTHRPFSWDTLEQSENTSQAEFFRFSLNASSFFWVCIDNRMKEKRSIW